MYFSHDWQIGARISYTLAAATGKPARAHSVIAPTKFVAKLASGLAKPDGMVVVPRDEVVPFVQQLPVGALWGVGERTEEALVRLGLRTESFDGAALLVSVPRGGIDALVSVMVKAGASVRSKALVGSHATRYTVTAAGPVSAGR